MVIGEKERVECPVCYGLGCLDYDEKFLHAIPCWGCNGRGYIIPIDKQELISSIREKVNI